MNKIFNLAIVLCSFAYSVSAQETVVPVSAQENLTMTIYNQGQALVKDTRTLDFSAGLNKVSFEDISDAVIPSSVLFKSDGVSVQEQNFNFDLLTRDNLFNKSVGQAVDVEFINPATGVVSNQKATLLSYNYGQPVLKINGKIETDYSGRVIFNDIPKNMSAKPSLVFDVVSETSGIKKAEVSYLTSGLSWTADYVAELDEKTNRLALTGLVTLVNDTQVSYYNTHLQLIAGNVNFASERKLLAVQNKVRRGAGADVAYAYSENMDAEAVAGYYLYTLKRPTDILSKQKKQVSLLSGQNIQTQKTYEYSSLLNYYSDSFFEKAKPTMYLSFMNSQQNGLGEALPEGMVRVYQKESSGRLIFVGSDIISHTAKNQKLRLKLGEDFDITATGKRISFNKIDAKNSQAEFEIKISNAKPVPVVVRYKQYLPDGWRILSETFKSQKETSNQIYWDLAVDAESEVVLTFKVAVGTK